MDCRSIDLIIRQFQTSAFKNCPILETHLLQKPDHNLLRKYRTGTIRILVLDDDLMIRKILQGIFRDQYEFSAVSTVGEFVHAVNKFNPDIVMIDVILPDGNGIDVCRELRSQIRYEQLFILIMTSFEDVNSIEAAYRAGANDYIRKPFIPFEISSKIHHISRTVNYQNSVINLYRDQKKSHERLFLLTELINRHINTYDKKKIISSIGEMAEILSCGYFEVSYMIDDIKETASKTITESFKPLTFDSLVPHMKFTESDEQKSEIMKISRGEGRVIYCLIMKFYYNKSPDGFVLLESTSRFDTELNDLVSMYLDFINLMGVDITMKMMLRTEVHKERKEIAKVRSLQVSLLPHFEQIDTYDISSTFIPMEEISGDFFDGFYSDRNTYQIILCDVSGHGVASSFVGSSIRGLLRAFDFSDRNAADILFDLNNSVVESLSSVYYFSSMILCTLRIDTGQITIASAGHPPCFYYNNEHRQFTQITNTGPLMGLIENAKFDEHRITLDPGDALILYTDGIIEAPAEKGGEMYGEERLFTLFQENVDRPSIEIIHTVVGSVYEHTGFSSLHDDATVICIKHR